MPGNRTWWAQARRATVPTLGTILRPGIVFMSVLTAVDRLMDMVGGA